MKTVRPEEEEVLGIMKLGHGRPEREKNDNEYNEHNVSIAAGVASRQEAPGIQGRKKKSSIAAI